MSGRRILVTGASSGIGAAIATELLGRGHQVWGTSRSPEHLTTVPGLRPVALDLNDSASIAATVETIRREVGSLDVLINNAGSGVFGALTTLDDTALKNQFQTLVFGPLQLTKGLLPLLQGESNALVINISSLAAPFPIPFMAPYSAGKAALSALTQCLQMELGQTSVQFVDVRPGDINTDFHEAMDTGGPEPSGDLGKRLRIAHRVVEKNIRGGPSPAKVGLAVRRLVESSSPPLRVNVGHFFQTTIAPMLARLLPHRLVHWGIKKYYRL